MSLTRDTDNINIFKDAAVYMAVSTSAPTNPTTVSTAFGATWTHLGSLNGDAGITNERTWDETNHFAWGQGKYRKGRKNYSEMRTITALEWNEGTAAIVDGSDSTSTDVYVNRGLLRYLAFEYTSDFDTTERVFTTMPADLWVPNRDRNESDPSSLVITAEIFANGSNKLYTRQFEGIAQTVTIGGTPSGGTFTLSYRGATTATIAYNAANTAVDSALEALSTIGTGNVTVTGSAGGPYTVTGLEFLLTGSGTGLTPSGTVTVARA